MCLPITIPNHTNVAELKVACWNIRGIFKRIHGFKYSKLNDQNVLDVLTANHIFGLVESHHTASQIADLHVAGFKNFNVCRPKTKNKASGGISVYIREELRPGISKIPRPGAE